MTDETVTATVVLSPAASGTQPASASTSSNAIFSAASFSNVQTAQTAQASSATTLALVAGASGSAGNWGATSLASSA
ncbi:hypothetical protein [Luteimicrobium album]|uniref:hypothetical protein n=1 Tax=Luteimicrobium album TaxID=1054550 RepID=UPI0024E18024|nr:hypothetical protein [Luteimicrobium album]